MARQFLILQGKNSTLTNVNLSVAWGSRGNMVQTNSRTARGWDVVYTRKRHLEVEV